MNFERLQKFPIASFATIFIGYITISGCLWHLGYWSTFKFNFFEYANFSDLFKSSLYPFLSNIWIFIVFSAYAIGSVLSFSFLPLRKPKHLTSEPTKLAKIVIAFLLSVSSGLIFIFSGLLFKSNSAWIVLPYAFSTLLGVLIFISSFLKEAIKDDVLRLLFFILIALYPSLNYSIGKKKAIAAKYMFDYTGVLSVSCSDTALRKQISSSAYLGSTNSHYFFSISQRVLIVRSDKIDAIILGEVFDAKNYKLWADQ